MVNLTRPSGLSLYLAGSPADRGGIAFLPAVDTGTDQFTLTTGAAQSGYFACWTGGGLDGSGVAKIDSALLSARADATPGNRSALQFFRSGEGVARKTISADGTVVNAIRLKLGDLAPGEVSGAHELALRNCQVELAGSGLRFIPVDTSAIHRLVQNDDLDIVNLVLELTGELAGAFTGAVVVAPSTLENNNFMSSATRRGDSAGGDEFEVAADSRRLIRGGGPSGTAPIKMRFGFDPVSGLDARRSFLAPPPGEPLLSEFITTHGHHVVLTPRPPLDAAESEAPLSPRFSFIRRRTLERPALGSVEFTDASLLLEGQFDVSLVDGDFNPVATPPEDFGIVIGDSQHEFLPAPRGEALDAAPLTLLLKRGAGHIAEASKAASVQPSRLVAAHEGADQVAYALLTRGDASPGQVVSEARSVRRLVGGDSLGVGTATLTHDPFRLERKQSVEHMPDGFVPVFPHTPGIDAGAGRPPIAVEAATERRKLLGLSSGDSEILADDVAETRRTPLGFEVTEKNGKIIKVTLARTSRTTTDGDQSPFAELAIKGTGADGEIGNEVLNALIRNHLFMVTNHSKDPASPPGALPDFVLSGKLELSEWGFEVDLWKDWSAAGANGTLPLVIIKGFEGCSIRELIDRPNLWSGTEYLKSEDSEQTAIAFAQARVHAAFDKAKESYDPMFGPFKRAIDDPNWNGVMVIEVPIVPQVLPAQVKGLLGGIDLSRLRAHHLAVPVRRISAENGDAISKPFAAINYEAGEANKVPYETGEAFNPGKFDGPQQAPNGSDGKFGDDDAQFFAMKVTVLRVGFNNGAIQSFYCEVDITLKSFFHDKGIALTKNGVSSDTVTLKGRFVRRMVDGATIETYDFFTEDTFNIKMSASFPLLSNVEVSRIAYVSSTARQGANEIVSSQFLINGDLKFKELGDFDFLDIDKVSFNGLSLDMRFLIRQGGKIGFPRFRFSPGSLIFDFSSSKVSSGIRGFFGSLPLKFTGFGWLGDLVTLPKLGYFNLKKKGGAGKSAPFFLKFSLGLGSLGSFASKLGDFMMDIGLVFGLDDHNDPFWDLGFKFGGSGGKDLDIGLEGFLEFRCERYEIVTLKYERPGVPAITYYGFRGLNAQLIVFGQELPPEGKASIYIFVDPERLGKADGVGWLLAGKDLVDEDFLRLDLLALGQRVDPFENLGGGFLTTRKVIEKFGNLVDGVDPPDGANDPHKLPAKVTYNPSRDWTIGFDAFIYKMIRLGFVVVDPELAGVLLDVKMGSGSDTSLFSIDVLYRKLTDDLGVYSIEVVLPPSLRNWQFGAAGITIPAIGVEIFTDGNWGVDIGYPADKDFSRSFHINIFPFTGAGGFYFRRVAGPAARLVPGYGKHAVTGALIQYKPVTEIGMGMRVGLGVTVAQGVLSAGLSVTVYGYLEGAYARLYNPDNLPTRARATYITVAGSVGVMGELYGYVDFGIIKAGVFVQLYLEYGLRLETQMATLIYVEVGVRVRVRVVIGSFKIFGKRIEIAISFSFASSVRFSQTIGHTENRDAYASSDMLELAANLLPPRGLREAFEWQNRIPTPEHWAGIAGPIALNVAIQPDLTVAPGTGGPEVHAVYLMATKLTLDETVSPVERLVQGLTAWAICACIKDMTPESLGTLTLNAADLVELRREVAKFGGRGPDYAAIVAFLQQDFAGRAELPVDEAGTSDENAPPAVLLPMPEGMVIERETPAGAEDIRFADYTFVNRVYREHLEAAIERFVHTQRRPGSEALADGENRSLAAVLTEEWVEMIIRAGLDRLAEAALVDGSDVVATERLATLVAEKPANKEQPGVPLRSQAAEIAVTASRFFAYGQRLPHPSHDGAVVPGWAEVPTRPSDAGSKIEERYFHAMLRLGGIQFPVADAINLRVPAGAYEGWLTVPAGVETGAIPKNRLNALLNSAAALDLSGALERDNLFAERKRYVSIGTTAMASVLPQAIHERNLLWMFGTEARIVASQAGNAAPMLAKAVPRTGEPHRFQPLVAAEAGHLIPAIVIDVALRKAATQAGDQAAVSDGFEIKAIPEPLRNLLDPFAPEHDGGETGVPGITEVRLFKALPDGSVPIADSAAHRATLIQSNLSVEVKPEFDALDTLDDDRIPPVADTTEPLRFVQLLRQAAIVNTGGYHLTYPGAGADLADLFAKAGASDPANDAARLRVVIALDSNDAGAFARANAYLSDDALGAGAPLDPGTVLAIVAGDTRDPLHAPGVIPIKLERTEPAAGTPARELAERFSNLALDVVVETEDGKELGRQYLDQAVATGPDFDKESEEDSDKRYFHVSVPAGKLAGYTDDNEVYKIVGCRAKVSGAWRDVYGNDWGRRLEEISVPIVYNDRLLGLAGLPYSRVGYWPGNAPLTLKLGFERSYEGLAVLDIEGLPDEFVPKEFIESMQRQIGEDAEHLRRARRQILDQRVTVNFATPLGKPAPVMKDRIAAHLAQTAADLDRLAQALQDGISAKKRGQLRQAMRDLTQSLEHVELFDVTVTAAKTEAFSEFEVRLEVARPSPVATAGLYDEMVVAEAAAMSGPRSPLSEIWIASEAVAANLRGANAGGAGLASGDAGGLIEALAGIVPDHRVASGYGETAGVTERSIWLIRRDFVAQVTGDGHFQDVKPVAFALPPLRTEPYSNIFQIDTLQGDTFSQKVVDADADSFGRRALERVERLLSPSVTIPILKQALQDADAAAARKKAREAIGRLLDAKEKLADELATRMAVVFTDDALSVPADNARTDRIRNAAADMMKRDLASHYRVTSFLAYFDKDKSGIPSDIRVAHGTIRQVGEDSGVRMQAFNLPLAPDGREISNDLLVICEAVPGSAGAAADSFPPPRALDLTHIQRQVRPDFASGEVSYRKTAWLKLAVEQGDTWASVGLQANGAVVPNILRVLPAMPILENEGFSAPDYQDGNDPAENLKNARRWISRRDIQWEAMPTDRLTAEIRYQRFAGPEALAAGPDLTARIISFVLATDSVMDAIENGADVDAYAWVSFQAEKLAARSEAEGMAAAFEGPRDFVVLNEQRIGSTLKLTASEVKLQASELRYGAVGGQLLAIRNDLTETLDATQPEGLKKRRLESHGLDILAFASVSTVISLTRNEKIGNRVLVDPFVYRMPKIASGEPIVPTLDVSEEVTAGTIHFVGGIPTNVKTALESFLDGLLKPPGEASQVGAIADLVFEHETGIFNRGLGGSKKPAWREEGGPVIEVRSGLDPKKPDAYAKAVTKMAENVSNWLSTKPALKGGKPIGSLIADARVYVAQDGTGSERDLRCLRLQRCRFNFN